MATIIDFSRERAARPTSSDRCHLKHEIIIFPGVRYERGRRAKELDKPDQPERDTLLILD